METGTGTRGAGRIAVIGTGALGGLYGARLAAAGEEVHFFARSDAAHLRAEGLRVESPWGDLHLRGLPVHSDPGGFPPCDTLFVCTKTTGNGDLPGILPRLAAPGALVCFLQNGLGAEEDAAAYLPGRTLAGGLCFLCSTRVGPGQIRHLDYGKITLAPLHPGEAPRLGAASDALSRAGVPVERAADLRWARWRKLVWNIPFNGLSVLLRAGTDELVRDPGTRRLVVEMMREVLAAARAEGHPIDPAFAGEMVADTERMKPYHPSMRADWEAGRPMEIGAIYDRPSEAARKAGSPMPLAESLAAQLRFLERRARGGGSHLSGCPGRMPGLSTPHRAVELP